MAIFLLLLSLLLSLPIVQTQLAKIVVNRVNSDFGVDIVVKKVDLSFLGNVNLKGIEIRDHHQDTLIFVDELSTSLLNAKKIVDNKLNLGNVSLEGVNMKLKTYKNEELDNLTIFVDSLDGEPSEKSSTPFILDSDNIFIDGLNFKFLDANRKDSIQFTAMNGGGTLENFKVEGPNVFADIKGLYFVENRGVKVTNLSTDFRYTKTSMNFKNTILETNNKTKLKANVLLTYKREHLADFNDKVLFTTSVKDSKVSVKDLSKFYNEISGADLLNVTAKMDGVLNNFSLTDVDVKSRRGITIQGNFGFVNAIKTQRGFVFDGDIQKLVANYGQLKSILPNLLGKTLPTEFRRLGNFDLSGLLKVTPEQLDATLAINSDIGSTVSDLQFSNIENIDEASYEGEIELYDFDFGKLTNDPLFGEISLQADVNGSGFNIENVNTSLIGKITSLTFNNYTYKDILVNGLFENKKFDGFLNANDKNCQLTFEGLADFSTAINNFDFNTNITYLDLYKTNLYTRDSLAQLKGKIKLDVSGNNFDNIIGKATFKNISYTNPKKQYNFEEFEVASEIKDSIKNISIRSKDIVNGTLKGKFLFAELIPITQNALGSVYTNYEPIAVTPNQFLDFNFNIHNQIIDVFLPKVAIGKNTKLKGKINSTKNSVRLTFTSPKINAYGNNIDDVVLRLNNKNPLYNTSLTASAVNTEYYKIKKLNLINRTSNDTLFFKSVFSAGKLANQDFNLDFYYTIDELKNSILGIQKSKLSYQGFNWTINPENNKQNKVAYNLNKQTYKASPFTIVSNNQKIEFKGELRDSTYKDIEAKFTKVKLASFLPTVDSLKLNGKLNGTLSYKENKEDEVIIPKGNLLVENFHVNDFYQGDLALNVEGNNSIEHYDVNLSLLNEKAKSIGATGSLDFSQERPLIDLNVYLKEYELEAFSPLGGTVLSNLRGSVTGDFTAKGYLRNPDFKGVLNLEKAGLKFPYLNIDFDLIGNTNISLDGQQFIFDYLTLQDIKHKTEGRLNGSIVHQNFEQWYLNLDLDTDKLLILDTVESEEVPYYGTGFLKGTAEITGLTSNLDVEVNGSTEKGTTFVIPLSDVKTIDSYKLIHFSSPNKVAEEIERSFEDVEGLDLKMFLEVTNDALAQVVIDKVNGSDLKGRGEGNLYIEIDTRGKFNMYGEYRVEEGDYNYKFAGISKKFEVQYGGTITWDGSPFDAELDITAIHRTKANPAQLLDNVNSTRKIPVDLYTKISGGLFNSTQDFDIKIPNANSNIASELDFVLNENDLNTKLQHFSFLLAFGTFYNEERLGESATSGLTGTASEIASNILSSILNTGDEKFQLGVGYTQGDRTDVDNLNTDDQVDVSVSTQLGDKVIVNGKVGVPIGTNTQTNVVGEVNVEVLLNEEGTLRSSFFNRQNEIQNNIEDDGYTQGVGISYQVNFNNIKELGEKIGLKKKKKKKEENKKDTIVVKKSGNVKFGKPKKNN